MQTKKTTHGGSGRGQGRKKGKPNAVLSVTIKQALKADLIAKYGSKELTKMIKAYLSELGCY